MYFVSTFVVELLILLLFPVQRAVAVAWASSACNDASTTPRVLSLISTLAGKPNAGRVSLL